MLFSYCSLQVFIPEWPVEEGWENSMCEHLKKVLEVLILVTSNLDEKSLHMAFLCNSNLHVRDGVW